MPPKRKADPPFYSAHAKKREYQTFKQALLDNAWIGYWDQEWNTYWDLPRPESRSIEIPICKAFDEKMPSYDKLKATRHDRVRTFESKEGETPSAKEAFWKPKYMKTTNPDELEKATLIPVPFQENLWVSTFFASVMTLLIWPPVLGIQIYRKGE